MAWNAAWKNRGTSSGVAKKKYKKKEVTPAIRKYVNMTVQQQIVKRAETKFHVATQSIGVDYTGAVYDLTSINQGDTDESRDGDAIYWKSQTFNYRVYGGDTTNALRVIIFQWFGNTSLHTPTVGDVLQQYGSTLGVLSTYLHDGEQGTNFRVFYDKTTTAVNGTDTVDKVFSVKVPLKYARKKCQFNAGSASRTNGLFLCVISDSAATPNPGIEYWSRVTFTDS